MRISLLLFCLLHATGLLTQAADFNKDVMPLFEKRCASCHTEQNGKKPKGGYIFDDVADIKSNVGPSFLIRPNDPGNSDLMAMVTRANKDHPMPPDDKDALSPKEIKTLREWIDGGAEIPDKGSPPTSKTGSGAKSGAAATSLPARKEIAAPEDWTNKDGKTIKASLVKLVSGKVTLRLTDGKEYTLALDKLDTASQERAMKTVKSP